MPNSLHRWFRSLCRPLAGLTQTAGAAAIAAGALVSSAAAAPSPATPPNIIFILADDLGYGDLGCYGQTKIATPNIDQLASNGLKFTQFYAGAPVCAPSRCVLMTGQHVGHATIRGNAKVNLAPTDTTVATLLKNGGYATGLFGKWGLGMEGTDGAPTHEGFDSFYGYVDQTMAHNYYPTYLVRNEERVPLRNVVPHPGKYGQGVATEKKDYSADLIADEALKFIREHQKQPFFLYFPATLPHANDEAKPDGMEVPNYGRYAKENWASPLKGYAAMVTLLDTEVGQIMAELKKLGLDDNTIVFFTSDNGPHKEGGNDPKFFNSSGPLRGLKREVYEGGIREPMVVRWPGHTPKGKITDQIAYFGDFMATATDLAGLSAPAKTDGISFAPTLLGKKSQQKQHDYLYWEFYEGASSQAVRMGEWKAVRSPMLTGKIELYDLKKDIGEQHNVAAEHADVVAKAKAAMEEAHVPSPMWKPGASSEPGS